MAVALISVFFFLTYVLPILFLKIVTSFSVKIKTTRLSILDDLIYYGLVPITSFAIAGSIAMLAGYNPDLDILTKIFFTPNSFANAAEFALLLDFIDINIKLYFLYLIVFLLSSAIYLTNVPRYFINQFLSPQPFRSQQFEHFSFVVDTSSYAAKAESAEVYVDILDSSGNFYSGKVFSYQNNKEGDIQSITLTDAVRYKKKQDGELVLKPIEGQLLYFLAEHILNINIRFTDFSYGNSNILNLEISAEHLAQYLTKTEEELNSRQSGSS